MTLDEIKKLGEKIKNEESSEEEQLALLKELNSIVDSIRADIKTVIN